MPNTCVKPMDNQGMNQGTTCAGSSTVLPLISLLLTPLCEQPTGTPRFPDSFTVIQSTPKIANLPLVEQKFYPVSTGPIIRTTK